MLTLPHLLEEAKCYGSVRWLRWLDGLVRCAKCGADEVIKRGKDDTILIASATPARVASGSLMI